MNEPIEYIVKYNQEVGRGDTLVDAIYECGERGYGVDWQDLEDLEVLVRFPEGWKSGKLKLSVEYDK